MSALRSFHPIPHALKSLRFLLFVLILPGVAISLIVLSGVTVSRVAASRFGKAYFVEGNPTLSSLTQSSGCLVPSFITPQSFGVSAHPRSIAAADFNGDGKQDIAVAKEGSNHVSVLLGSGFGTETSFPIGGQSINVAVGDFNGDGKRDLAVTKISPAGVAVLLGNGNGGFGAASSYPAGSYPDSITVSDFNTDGKQDLAIANSSSSIVLVLLGNGSGGFSAPTSYSVGFSPGNTVAGDFNQDNKVDLAVGTNSGVSLLVGNGLGGFNTAVNFNAGGGTDSIAAGDFNGDNKLDLAAANTYSGAISVLLGNGAGGFSPPVKILVDYPGMVIATDLNNDGKLDLAGSIQGHSSVLALLGNGTGGFSTPANFAVSSDPVALVAGDFNNDNKPDLVTANYSSYDVTLLTGDGTGKFNAPPSFIVAGRPESVAIGDLNSDGKLDFVSTDYFSNNLAVFLGDGAGGIMTRSYLAAGGNARKVAAADFNNDGKPDLATANYSSNNVSILLGNGSGSFGQPAIYAVGSGPFSIGVGDFNRDNRVDLVTANVNTANLTILLGNGTGGFGGRTDLAVGNGPSDVAVGDFNGDQALDLATTNHSSSNISLLIGNGAGGFGAPTNFAAGLYTSGAAVGDFNLDHRPDLVTGSSTNQVSNVLLWLGGAGGFSPPANVTAGSTPNFIVAGDFNGDGKPDLAVKAYVGISVLLGNGAGGFAPPIFFDVAGPDSIAPGDFNGDGKLDLIMTSTEGFLSILLNTCAPAAVNTPPTITVANVVTRRQGSLGTNSIIATVNDAETPAGSLQVTAASNPAGVIVTNILNNNGTITADVKAACGAPAGANSVTLSVTDGGLLTTSATFEVNVTANAPPTAGTFLNSAVGISETLIITPSVPPSDNGLIANITASAPGFTGAITGNPATSGLTINNAGPLGAYTVTVTVTDNCGATATTTFTLNVVLRPDLQVIGANLPASVLTDTAFEAVWTDKNEGSGQAQAPWLDKVFLSMDNQIGNDSLLASFPLELSLAPGQSAPRRQSLSIPRSLVPADGQYFIIVVADAGNNVNEGSNENNNWRSMPITVIRRSLPDLIVQSIEAPHTAFFDQTVTIRWTIKNIGAGSTNATEWTDWVYLSSDNVPEIEDPVRLPVQNFSYLNTGESYLASLDVRIPRGLVGNYNVLVYTDFDGTNHRGAAGKIFDNDKVEEENEDNNWAVVRPIRIDAPPLPDLQVAFANAPEQAFTGQAIQIDWRVENRAAATRPDQTGWADSFYLSQDTTLNTAQDRLIGSRRRAGGLAQNESYTVNSFSVNIPNNIAGDWYLFVVTDSGDEIYEFGNEGNNSNYDQQRIRITATPPELIVQSITAPAVGAAARQVTVSWTVKNQGAFDAPPAWFDTVYISSDATLDPATDTPLATVERSNVLGPGLTYNGSAVVTLPACSAGPFHLFVFTDSRQQTFEYDPNYEAEQNNYSQPKPIQIISLPPDLQATAVNHPATGNAGQPISVSWSVTNRGAGPTIEGDWTDNLYLSITPMFNVDSALSLGSFRHTGNLDPNASYSRTENVVVPITAQGVYYFFIVTDASDGVEECSNEGNNRLVAAAVINISNNLPDLRVTAVTAPATALAGQLLNLSWSGQNAGSAAALNNAWNDRVYLSSDPTFDDNDMLLATKLINGPLSISATYAGSAQVTIPIIPAGAYFLIVVADSNNYVFEGRSEDNNTNSSAIQIQNPNVDLRVTAVDAPAQAFSGTQITVNWAVNNAGVAQTLAARWTDNVIISRDQIPDATDRVIGYFVHDGALSGGGNYNATLNVEIPPGFSGPSYLFVRTDVHNAVGETDENNNFGYDLGPIDLQIPQPADLVVTAINFPGAGTPGEAATITWTVRNNSSNAAIGRWTDAVYISRNETWDINDPEVGRADKTGPLAAGQSYTGALSVALPPVEPGNYYLIVRTDVRNRVREDNENNNTTASTSRMGVDVLELTLGVARNSTIKTGQERYYKVNVPGDETLLFTLDGQNPQTSNELYARFELLPSLSSFDFNFSRPYEPDQEIVVPETQTGTYYSLIRGANVPSGADPVSIKAEIVPFGLRFVTPNSGGNISDVTLSLHGGQLSNLRQARLLGNVIVTARQLIVADDSVAYTTFDLRGVAPGVYDLEITKGDLSYDASTKTVSEIATKATLPKSFNVLPGKIQKPEIRLVLPEAARPGRVFSLTVHYTNPSLTDIPAPWIHLSARGGKIKLSNQTGSAQVFRSSVDLLGLNQSSLAGVLGPGASGYITIEAISEPGSQSINFSLQSKSADDSPVDYNRLYRLAGSPSDLEAWNQFVSLAGNNWGSLLNALGAEISKYQIAGSYIYDPYELIRLVIERISIKENSPSGVSRGNALASYTNNTFVGSNRVSWPYLSTESLSIKKQQTPAHTTTPSPTPLCNPRPTYCTELTDAMRDSSIPYIAYYAVGEISQSFFYLWLNRLMPAVFTPPAILGVEKAIRSTATYQSGQKEITDYIKRYVQLSFDSDEELCEANGPIVIDFMKGIPGKLDPLAIPSGPFSPAGWFQTSGYPGSIVRLLRFNRSTEADIFYTFGTATLVVPQVVEVQVKRESKKINVSSDVDFALYDVYDFNNNRVPTIIDPPRPSISVQPFIQGAYILQECCGFTGSEVSVFLGKIGIESAFDTDCECNGDADCDECPNPECDEDDNGDVPIRRPQDPNEKLNTAGFGPQGFVSSQQAITYTINFENLSTALGFAQRVRIVDQIASNLDWRTFRLVEVGFNNYRVQVPANRAFFQGRLQLGADLGNLLADMSAGIDIATGQVSWTLTAIDPNTGELPISALLGLLPPNDSTGRGQGYVIFTIQPKAGLATGAEITNKATIVFDTEEPIITNTVLNTIDASAPSSAVAALPPTSPAMFNVSWSGDDAAGGAGLKNFDIWVSENNGPYQPFLTGATDAGAQFTGQNGKTYRFYSIARDNAGNVEAAPAAPDAVTSVGVAQNSVSTLTGLTPNLSNAGGPPFTLTVNGANFINASVVNWNGSARVTTFISATQLTASIIAADIAGAGVANVTVVNPPPGGGTSNALAFTINALPVITTAVGVARQQGSPGAAATIATVSDIETPAGNLIIAVNSAPPGLSITNLANANGAISANIAAGCTAVVGANTVVLKVTDGIGAMTTANLVVNVTTNAPPVLGNYSSAGTININAGTTVIPSALPSDNGVVVSLTASAAGFTGTLNINQTTGVVTIGDAAPAGNYTVTVTATDNCGAIATRTFGLVVNAPPTITAQTISRRQGSAGSVSAVATAGDDLTPVGELTVVTTSGPAGITVTEIANNKGTISAKVTASCSATVGANQVGLKVTDGGGLTATVNLTVNVTANTPPALGTYTAPVMVYGETRILPASAGPSDNGSVSNVAVSVGPATFTGTVSVDPTTGDVTISNAGPPGAYSVTVTAKDNCDAVSTRTIALTVNKANTSTTLTSSVNPSIVGQPVTLSATLSVVSPGGGSPAGTVQFKDNGQPIGAPVGLTNGVAKVTTTALQFGAHPITAEYGGNVFLNASAGSISQIVDDYKITASDPLVCTGPGNVLNVTAQVTNSGNSSQTITFTAQPNVAGQFFVINNSCVATGGASGACTTAPSEVSFNGSLAPGKTLTITYQVQLGDGVTSGAQICANSQVRLNGGVAATVQACTTVNCPAPGVGEIPSAASMLSDQKAGSVLVYNLYTSSASAPNSQNTRINITNTHAALSAAVHLFFVDGSNCSVADAFICLTPNQTTSFVASDLDPGTTGYLVAVAVDNVTGCPINFNYLIGDEYVKLSSGHAANLGAEALSALAGGLPVCNADSNIVELKFDGVSYNRLPRVLAVDNIPSRSDGNDTILVINQIGGNLGIGTNTLGALTGLIYDDQEVSRSFSIPPGSCQLRSSLSNNFPRTVPRYEQVIPAGRSGWMKFWPANDAGLLGSVFNFNLNANANAGSFNHGRNLHKLTFANNVNLTIPIVPPPCR